MLTQGVRRNGESEAWKIFLVFVFNMSKALAVVGATAAIAASALVGYAVYFDYKRRHDPEFRRALSKNR